MPLGHIIFSNKITSLNEFPITCYFSCYSKKILCENSCLSRNEKNNEMNKQLFLSFDVWYPPKLIISQQSRRQEKKENLITETSEPDDNRTSLRTRQYSFASAKFHFLSHTSVIKLRTETRKLHLGHSEINFFLILSRNPNKSDGLAFSLNWSHNK